MSDARAQAALDAAFRHHGRDALYTPAGGAARTVRVRPASPDAVYSPMGVPSLAENPSVELRVAEVPELKRGDMLNFALPESAAPRDWRVEDVLRVDGRRLKWKAELRRV
ncbi:hypothetical protein [Parvibaculum sp.]|uniref:head-tail joining protein n=1 Tax=Parvibaculum sp. TaxID=2024848 RepID=UPI002612E225|nr:hypothetical protein [Parvibaculum sp.]MCW5727247.1 hypothetical protein [Parvibaculum sp.]